MTNCTNSLSKIIGKLAVSTAVFILAGCSSTNSFLQGERIDYKSASKKSTTSTLDVPPDLSQISRDNRFSIPDAGVNGQANSGSGSGSTASGSTVSGSTVLTASGFNAKSANTTTATALPTAQPSIALNSFQDMRIERDGSQRWLLVKRSPDVLWPKIIDFWLENGFTMSQESQSAGVMETDWAENRAKIPEDFLRKTIGYVFDSLYDTGERDKFRTRLERRSDGSTEIYISHRGAEEVLVGSQKDSTRWTARPNDPALEATFLTRLMVSLGESQEKAKELVGAPVDQPAKAKLVKSGTTSIVDVDESFERAWRRVGLALDRVGFTVEDRDRNKGIYFVRYMDQDDSTNKEGFFSRLFGSDDKEKNAKRYRILVNGEGNVSHISVQNNDGGAENSAASEKILKLLLDQLK